MSAEAQHGPKAQHGRRSASPGLPCPNRCFRSLLHRPRDTLDCKPAGQSAHDWCRCVSASGAFHCHPDSPAGLAPVHLCDSHPRSVRQVGGVAALVAAAGRPATAACCGRRRRLTSTVLCHLALGALQHTCTPLFYSLEYASYCAAG
jgi:hypothetical protein